MEQIKMDVDEFKSRLIESSKYFDESSVLTAQSVNDVFATITLFFSPSEQALRKSKEGNSIKKESLRVVRLLVDRLLPPNTLADGAIVAACQQLRGLDRLVEDDLVLLVVVWKELLRLASGHPDLFQRSLDLGELFSSLWSYVRDGTKQWCTELDLLTSSNVEGGINVSVITKTSKLLLMLMKYLTTLSQTFHHCLPNPQCAHRAASAMSAFYGAALYAAYRRDQTKLFPFDTAPVLLKMAEPFTLLFGPRSSMLQTPASTSSSALDSFHWSLIQGLAPRYETGEDSSDARVSGLDQVGFPEKMLWLGRLEVMLMLTGSEFCPVTQGSTALFSEFDMSSETLWQNKRPLDLENDFGTQMFRRIVLCLTKLLLLTSRNHFSDAVVALSGWMGDPHPIIKELAVTTATCFASKLPSPVQSSALCCAFSDAMSNELCCPWFADSCADLLYNCLSNQILSEDAQQRTVLIDKLPSASDLLSGLSSQTPQVNTLTLKKVVPRTLRVLLSLIRPPSLYHGCAWRGPELLADSSRSMLIHRCSEYASEVVSVLGHASSLTDQLLNLSIVLLAPVSQSSQSSPTHLCPSQHRSVIGNFVATQVLCSLEQAVCSAVSLIEVHASESGRLSKALAIVSQAIEQCGDASCLGSFSLPLDKFLIALSAALTRLSRAWSCCQISSCCESYEVILSEACLALSRLGSAPIGFHGPLFEETKLIADVLAQHYSQNQNCGIIFKSSVVLCVDQLTLCASKPSCLHELVQRLGKCSQNEANMLNKLLFTGSFHPLLYSSFSKTQPPSLHEDDVIERRMSQVAQSLKRKRKDQREAGLLKVASSSNPISTPIAARWCPQQGNVSSCFKISLPDKLPSSCSFDGTKLMITLEFAVDQTDASLVPFRTGKDQKPSSAEFTHSPESGMTTLAVIPEGTLE